MAWLLKFQSSMKKIVEANLSQHVIWEKLNKKLLWVSLRFLDLYANDA